MTEHGNPAANPCCRGTFDRRAHAGRPAAGAGGCELFDRGRRDAVSRRRIRIRKIPDGAFDHAASIGVAEAARRVDPARGPRTDELERTGDARRARRRDRDDLPGADDFAQSRHVGWRATHRGHPHARRRERRRRGGARPAHARRRAHHRAGPSHGAISARAFRRHEAARDDCHGAFLPPQSADRRRTDDRPRRHCPGADPDPHARVEKRIRLGDPAHHPRYGRGRRNGRPCRDAEIRPVDRARLHDRYFRAPARASHARVARSRAAARRFRRHGRAAACHVVFSPRAAAASPFCWSAISR